MDKPPEENGLKLSH